MSISEGPGPPMTRRSTATSDPFRVAWMRRSGDGVWLAAGVDGAGAATQRILFPRSAAGGAVSGSPKTTPTIAPRAPRTCGTDWPGGLNPVRAHVGNGVTRTADAHDKACAGVESGVARVDDGADVVLVQPVSTATA